MSVGRAVLTLVVCLLSMSAFAALQLPSDITAEATGPNGAAVQYSAGASGSGDDENGRPIDSATCSPISGSTFALGTTAVSCTGSSGGSGSFKVIVVDTKGPALSVPRDFSVPASSSSGATVTYNVSARDAVDGQLAVHCSPASGTFFAVGSHTVQCSAADSRNNMSSDSFVVSVIAQPPPPPQVPNDITKEATGPQGAVVNYSAPGDGDDENGRPTSNGNCSPASGSTFPLGTTIVQCSGGSFKIKIVDTTAPTLFVPGDIFQQTTDPSGTVVSYIATAQDTVDGFVPVICNPPSGSNFGVGTTFVQCSAGDTHGNQSHGSFTVTVNQTAAPDTEAPTITSIEASPETLSPPNGKLRDVELDVDVIDNIDDSPLVRIYDVTANEAIDGNDWDITGLLSVKLRADRDPHGSGRVYTVHVEAIDDAGNRSTASTNVTVPHDSSGDGTSSAPPPTTGKRRAVRRG